MDAGNDYIIQAEKITINRGGRAAVDNVSFSMRTGDHLAITGAAGSGKTTLAQALAGRIYYKGRINIAAATGRHIAWIEQQHHFKNLSNTGDFYYQQRFNSQDADDAQTVAEVLSATGGNIEFILDTMKIRHLADEPLIQLSNGENKKLQLALALLSGPSMLIMDQPFIGLDRGSRSDLHHSINELAKQGITIIIVTTPDEIPDSITWIIELEEGKLKSLQDRNEFINHYSKRKQKDIQTDIDHDKLKVLLNSNHQPAFEMAIRMKNVRIEYAGKKILQDINWEVKKGECWLLSGPNGAGKSTLLSLVTADNPQAYANEIYLFDRKRGSGESIWDIKKQIGFLSPELHLFFDQGCSSFEAIASGFFDTIGLFRQLSEEQVELVNTWMRIAKVDKLKQKRLYELSAGEQRIVLLVRALVKNPPLLILDEPCQGLDAAKQSELLELIDTICRIGNKTLVFVTHYADEIPACISRFITLENGKVREINS